MDVEGCWRDVAGGTMKQEVQVAGGEGRKEAFYEKRLHGKFMRDVSEVADERLWQ